MRGREGQSLKGFMFLDPSSAHNAPVLAKKVIPTRDFEMLKWVCIRSKYLYYCVGFWHWLQSLMSCS